MGITNGEEVIARREEEECYVHTDARGNRTAGSQGEYPWHKQKRANRADSEKPSLLGLEPSIAGGMLCQLIGDYRDQKAAREKEISRIKEEKKRLEEEEKRIETEVEKLQVRIEEFEVLQQGLEDRLEENP